MLLLTWPLNSRAAPPSVTTFNKLILELELTAPSAVACRRCACVKGWERLQETASISKTGKW